jgi:hypothetical protein
MPEIFYHSSLWKPTLDEVMRQHIKPGHKVAVVGTDVDDTTLLMAQLVGPKGKVYSFEGENLLDKNVVVKSVVIDPDKPVPPEEKQSGEAHDLIIVTKTNLDELVRPPINFLRIEAQGGETVVVRGARNLIINSPELLVLTQFWPYGLIRGCKDDGRELLTFFTNYDFKLYIMEKGAAKPHPVAMPDLLGAFKVDKDEFCYLLLTRGVL